MSTYTSQYFQNGEQLDQALMNATNAVSHAPQTLTEEQQAQARANINAMSADTEIPEVPASLPNPNALTFTGAVNATYNGSNAVTVEIPQGGSGSGIDVSGASVGQTIQVAAVDENGKPTAWSPVDFPSDGWELITSFTVAEEHIASGYFLNVTAKDNGDSFEYRQLMLCLDGTTLTGLVAGSYQRVDCYKDTVAQNRFASFDSSRVPFGAGGTAFKATYEISVFNGLVRAIVCGGQYDTTNLIFRNDYSDKTDLNASIKSLKLSNYGKDGVWRTVALNAGGSVAIYGRK